MTFVLSAFLAAAVVAAVVLFTRKRTLEASLEQAVRDRERLDGTVGRLQQEVRQTTEELQRTRAEGDALRTTIAHRDGRIAALAKYEGLVDAEERAARILKDADAAAAGILNRARLDSDAMRADAERVKQQATEAAEQERAAASVRAREQKQAAELALSSATAEADRIIEDAKKRAQEIAGEAYEAMQKAQQWEQTAEAMRNVIEGYGDRYIVPTFTVLDQFADEFGFADAAQRLKSARDRVRHMVKNGTAAACDYVEENRKTTAIEFVLLAFNGDVDSVLADVRHDNYGTLERKIRDAFSIVNHLGRAFRNARIKDEYLQARLEELKWAVAVHELKVKERDEQRAIRERIREEEKAQREFERAMKDAQKEEEMLLKAMEKVRGQVEKATDEQRAKYEQQLAELNEKLRAAEEKNQRALSMAQQTRSGHVYIISNVGSFGDDVFKIGLTRRLDPQERIWELGDASVPFDFDVHALIRSEDAPALERALQKIFLRNQVNKVNPRKEFFRVALGAIRAEVEKLGLQATWTMAAECQEYKETLAIERAMKEQKLDEREWLDQQMKGLDTTVAEPAVREAVG